MEEIHEKSAVELSWDKVCNIISDEIEKILGLHIECKANIVEHLFLERDVRRLSSPPT